MMVQQNMHETTLTLSPLEAEVLYKAINEDSGFAFDRATLQLITKMFAPINKNTSKALQEARKEFASKYKECWDCGKWVEHNDIDDETHACRVCQRTYA